MKIVAWIIFISAVLAFLSPIVAMFLADWHEKKEKEEKERHTCAICGRTQKELIIICDDCFIEGI